MSLLPLLDLIGEAETAALLGVITGIIFGVAAQRSRFCLRAATSQFARGVMGDKVAVWLLTFSTALAWVQGAKLLGYVNVPEARMMAVPGSWSGAIIGGLIFGAGMILARGCSGRLLTLAATGNLRSLVSGLVFAVVAQMSLHGWLRPLREKIASLWITPDGHNVDLLVAGGLPNWFGLATGLALAAFALAVSSYNKITISRLVFASGVGFSVAVGWVFTTALAQIVFDPIQIESVTFTGPSANTLMFFLENQAVLSFDIGLVPGVFLGSFLASIVTKEFKFQGFKNEANMRRALLGAAMMGFGGMLAGGCAIGAGVTGSSILAGTAWVALMSMWVGGMLTDFCVDQGKASKQIA